MYEGYVELAEKLNQLTPRRFSPRRPFSSTAGPRRWRNAAKVARYYTKRPAVIVFDDALPTAAP